MIAKLLFRSLLAGLCATSGAAYAASVPSQKKAPTSAPKLQVDSTPIEAKPGVVLSYADVVEPVQKAVVAIYSTKIVRERVVTNPLFRQLFPDLPEERESTQAGLGSGVIVSTDGYILTNNHVIEDADEVKVSLADGRDITAKIIGSDPKTDIAVIKIEAPGLSAVTLADSDKLRVGDVVFAVGNPLNVGQTVTMGIVSAKNRNVRILEDIGGYEDFIQTDAAINMGNSGGALVDARGRLVGINSAIISPSRGNIGIGLAVPINLASWIMTSLIETGAVARGYLGVSTEPITADIAEQLGLPRETRGVIVADVAPGKPADKAGLKLTDAILALNEHPIASRDELRLQIARIQPGDTVRLKIVRDGKERTVEVKLDRFDDKPNELFPGITVRLLTVQDRRSLGIDPRVTGLLITEVTDSSPFTDQLAPGVVIIEINRAPLDTLERARGLIKPGRNLVQVYYNGTVRTLALNVP